MILNQKAGGGAFEVVKAANGTGAPFHGTGVRVFRGGAAMGVSERHLQSSSRHSRIPVWHPVMICRNRGHESGALGHT